MGRTVGDEGDFAGGRENVACMDVFHQVPLEVLHDALRMSSDDSPEQALEVKIIGVLRPRLSPNFESANG